MGSNVSVEVLDAIAAALRLSETERAHLLHLARPGAGRTPPGTGRPGLTACRAGPP